MAHYKKRRKYKHPSRSRSGKSAISHSRKRKTKFDFSFLVLAGVIGVGMYFLYTKSDHKPHSERGKLDQESDTFTLDEKVKQKVRDLKLKKEIGSQENLSEKFKKKPVGKIDNLEPEVSDLDMGVSFPDNAPIKEVSKELSEKPFVNDVYEDPENVIRRQLAHSEWMEKHLQERNQKEKEEFIRRFVQSAREQGYNVYFTEDMKAILEPIDPEEEKKKKGEFDEVKINWK